MKRQFELSDIFQKEISKNVQIFVTTHSPAFAFATENEKSKIYRVSYEKDEALCFRSSSYHFKCILLGLRANTQELYDN
jgi:predicted ATP-dependent endonuclease of OLD family